MVTAVLMEWLRLSIMIAQLMLFLVVKSQEDEKLRFVQVRTRRSPASTTDIASVRECKAMWQSISHTERIVFMCFAGAWQK